MTEQETHDHSVAAQSAWLCAVWSRPRRRLMIGVTLFIALSHALSCSPTRSQPLDQASASQQIVDALRRGERDVAASVAEKLLAESPDAPPVWQLAGDAFLRAGRIEQAARLYDRFAAARPETVPYLWQRGIALTLAGRYQDAARQFESHREVNPHDVENAAWHLLCLAKATTLKEARAKLLPAPGDPRPPLNEILQTYKDGETKPVYDRIESMPANTPARRSAEFYGHLYLGMLADAEGDSEQAVRLLKRSVEHAGNDYMGDVARVYLEVVQRAGNRNE